MFCVLLKNVHRAEKFLQTDEILTSPGDALGELNKPQVSLNGKTGKTYNFSL